MLTVSDSMSAAKLACGNCQHLFTVKQAIVTESANQNTLVKPTPLPNANTVPSPAQATVKEKWLNQRYELKTRLGQGSFGVVWKAFDHRLKRDVAVKLLHPHLVVSPNEVKQFDMEAGILTQLTHPHIVPLLDRGRHGNHRYFVSSFIQGASLQSIIPRGGMPAKRAARLTIQILQAIRYAYGKNVLHRDIKAENAMVGENDQLWLLDFGISTVFAVDREAMQTSKVRVGTPAYMAPEAIRGKHTHASDVYSTGVVLYRLLTGRLPFEDTGLEVLTRIQQEEPPPPSQLQPQLDPELETICLKAVAKNLETRYATAAAFEQALVNWQENQGASAYNLKMIPGVEAKEKDGSQRIWLIAGGLAVVLAVSLGITWILVRNGDTSKRKPTTTQKKPFFE